MSLKEFCNSDFQRALREFKAQNQAKSKLAKQAVACVKGETKDECHHPYTINSNGWRICLTCREQFRKAKVFFRNEDYEERLLIKDTGPDRVKEIRDTLNELMCLIVRRSRTKSVYVEPPEAGLPSELFDHLRWLCDICEKYLMPSDQPKEDGKQRAPFSIRCRTRSLCAAVLWEKVKELKLPMSMSEFSRKCAVSKGTITRTCKQLDNK